MTQSLRAAIDAAVAQLRSVSDPVARYQETRRARRVLEESDAEFRAIEREIVIELRDEAGQQRTWGEVGQMLGGLSRQRAKQISHGVQPGVSHDIESTDPRA